MMKAKVLNLILIISSLFGYLEWGSDQKMFLWQGELDVLSKLFTDPMSVIHPFTLFPLIGQLLLLFTLFQKEPSKLLTFLGMGGLTLLLGLMFAIGLMNTNYKIIFSTLPFLLTAIVTIIYHIKSRRQAKL